MKIDPLSGNREFKKMYWERYLHAQATPKPSRPQDVMTFEMVDFSDSTSEKLEIQRVASIITSLSDDHVNERIRKLRNSYSDIDDAIIDKLIMEEL
jgi:hypothetical protein